MATAPQRLKRRREFLRVAAQGSRAAVHGLVLQAMPTGSPVTRVGFTVTKKLGNAVVRNRTRRRLKEAARMLLQTREVTGYDLVLIGRDATRGRKFDQLVSDLARALDKAGVA